jgi:Bacterial SH3 domain
VATGGAASALFTGQDQPSAAPEQPAAEQVVTPDESSPTTSSPPTTTRTPPERASRDRERPALAEPEVQSGRALKAEPIDTEQRYLTEDLNLWSGPGEDTTLLKVLDTGSKVQVTGREVDGYAQIVHNDQLRWVNADYLSKTEPAADSGGSGSGGGGGGSGGGDSGGLSDAACASGSGVEDGIVANAIVVYRAVCAEFPEITTYYGYRAGDSGPHGTGHAIDIMITDSATGDAIAEFVQDNYQELGVSQIIWSQRIWTVQRMSEGWRWMEDRGSDTANHYDHVHVTVY